MDEDLRARITGLSAQVDQARADVGRGVVADLSGLDQQVAGLCEQAGTLPRPEGKAVLVELEALLQALGRLKAAMAEQFETVQAELRAHGRRTQAARAYRRPPGTGGREA